MKITSTIRSKFSMIKYIFLLILLIPALSMGGTGIIRSNSDQEPQVITFKENPENPNLMMYKFCLTNAKKKCISLGNEDGVRKDLLIKEIQNIKNLERDLKYLRPTVMIIILAVSYLAIKFSWGTSSGFFIASGSSLATNAIYSKNYDPIIFSEMYKFLNPKTNGLFILEPKDFSIVDFSHQLSKRLNNIEQQLNEKDYLNGLSLYP